MKNVEIVKYLVENKTRVKNILTRYAVSMKNKWYNEDYKYYDEDHQTVIKNIPLIDGVVLVVEAVEAYHDYMLDICIEINGVSYFVVESDGVDAEYCWSEPNDNRPIMRDVRHAYQTLVGRLALNEINRDIVINTVEYEYKREK